MLKALAKDPARALPGRRLVHQGARGRGGAAAAGAGGHREHGGLRARGVAPAPRRRRVGCRRPPAARRRLAADAATCRRRRRTGSRRSPPAPAATRWIVAGVLAAAGRDRRGWPSCCWARASRSTVPPVVGQTLEQASQRLDRAGPRRRGQAPRRPGAARLRVRAVAQSGSAGGRGLDRHAVRLQRARRRSRSRTWSAWTRPMRAGACAARRSAADVERESSTKVPEGIVIRTDPGPGRLIERDSSVTLFVSTRPGRGGRAERRRRGPGERGRPAARGGPQPDRARALRRASRSTPWSTRRPPAASEVDEGSTVTIFVSDGKVREVPDVTGSHAGRGRGRAARTPASTSACARARPTSPTRTARCCRSPRAAASSGARARR